MTVDDREVVRELVATRNGQAGQEDVRPQIRKTRDIESHLPWLSGNNVKTIVVPLHARFVLRSRAESVKPCGLERVVVVMNGTAPREAGQGLHVGILFPVVPEAVVNRELVGLVEMVIKAAGGKVCSRCESKQTSVVLKLVHEEGTSGTSRIQGQSTVEYSRAGMGGQVRLVRKRGRQTSRNGGADGTAQARHRRV